MCVERIQRIVTALVLSLAAVLLNQAVPWAIYLLYFVIVMMATWGLLGFCPGVWLMKKLGLKSCEV